MLQVPEVDVLGVVAAEEEIQTPVAVVVEPDGRVRVDPRGQVGPVGDARETFARVVVEELGPAPLVEEEVFEAVVVVVRDADAGAPPAPVESRERR